MSWNKEEYGRRLGLAYGRLIMTVRKFEKIRYEHVPENIFYGEFRKMEMKTDRLQLRPIGMEYLETTHAYASDLENTKYMLFLPNESIEETAEFLRSMEGEWQKENQTYYEFAILKDQKHIGSIGLEWVIFSDNYLPEEANFLLQKQKEKKTVMEFGWILHKDYWGQGIMIEAAQALLEFAIQELGVRHFIAHCDSENQGSYKVMEKLGMQRKACYGGRKNRASKEERKEFLYELVL